MMNASLLGQHREQAASAHIVFIAEAGGRRRGRAGKALMLRRVLITLAALIVAVFAFIGYNAYSVKRPAAVGDSAPQITLASPRPAHEDDSQLPATGTPETTPETTSAGARTAGGITPPTADTIAPDPPNGQTFGGSGHYQLYRQGDLTWRLNTDTGQACILFATNDEWRKPRVYRSGCRGRS